jgi:hypothetical protein
LITTITTYSVATIPGTIGLLAELSHEHTPLSYFLQS